MAFSVSQGLVPLRNVAARRSQRPSTNRRATVTRASGRDEQKLDLERVSKIEEEVRKVAIPSIELIFSILSCRCCIIPLVISMCSSQINRQRELIASQREAIARQRAALDVQQTELVSTSASGEGTVAELHLPACLVALCRSDPEPGFAREAPNWPDSGPWW